MIHRIPTAGGALRIVSALGLTSCLILSNAFATDDEDDQAGNKASVPVAEAPAASSSPLPSLASPPPILGCQDGNIQTLAVATSSGGGVGFFGPQIGNDGVFGPGGDSPWGCEFNWMSGGLYPSGAWYELEWADPVRICQIWVDTKTQPAECGANPNRGLHGADIQTWDGFHFVDEGSTTNANDDWEFVIPTCPITTSLRLYNVGPVSTEFQSDNPVLYELKVYDCNLIAVEIDIMPSDPGNNLNLRAGSGASISVAILSVDESLESPNEIDPSTLEFGPGKASISGLPRVRDVDRDGNKDLVVKFLTEETGIACGDTHAILSGSTFNSEPISGSDAINTFNCPRVRKRW
jgi:hypothetical protein